jgi:hypothetical protein
MKNRFEFVFNECESAGGEEIARFVSNKKSKLIESVTKFISKLDAKAFSGDDRLEMDFIDNKTEENLTVHLIQIKALRLNNWGDKQDEIIPLKTREEDYADTDEED